MSWGEYNLANKIKDFTLNLLAFLKKKELTAKIFTILFTQLKFVLAKCNIKFSILQQTIVIACISLGFQQGTIFTILAMAQQFIYNQEYDKLKNFVNKFLKDKNFQEKLKNF